jgi:hypothetical protein
VYIYMAAVTSLYTRARVPRHGRRQRHVPIGAGEQAAEAAAAASGRPLPQAQPTSAAASSRAWYSPRSEQRATAVPVEIRCPC